MVKQYSVNHQIKAEQVRLISSDGTMRGIVPLFEALEAAQADGLDLVEVAKGKDKFPICKVLDYGRMVYKKKKEEKRRKHKQTQHTKEIKCSFNIADHDLAIKHRKVKEFLSKHYIVRYVLELKGRETHLANEAIEKMNKHLKEFAGMATWEIPSISGRGTRVNVSSVLRAS